MLDAALDYTRNGWHVLPLNGKIPRTAHGVDDASDDPEVIRSWWTRWPDANIGARVPDQLVVLDVDPRNGGSVNTLNPSPTLTCISGRRDGGAHLYYLRPSGPLVGTRLPSGCDLKLNGYCVMPPSLHPATAEPYRWDNADIAPLPTHLRQMLRPPERQRESRRRGAGTGEHLVDLVAQQVEGNRNNALFWAACRADEDGLLDELSDDLIDAAVTVGIGETSARAQIASARGRSTH